MSVNQNQRLLLGVGAMKSGTTFLYKLLNKHPELCFTPEKELHFLAHMYGLDYASMRPIIDEYPEMPAPHLGEILSIEFRRSRLAAVMRGRFAGLVDPQDVRDIAIWYATKYFRPEVDWQWVKGVFATAKPEQWWCDFSNYNAYVTSEAIVEARKNFSDIKAIYLLREPRDRLWSHIKFDARYGLPQDSSQPEVVMGKYLRDSHICAHGDYGTVVQRLHQMLGRENLLLINFDDLIHAPAAQIEKITQFLGIDVSSSISNKDGGKPSNVGPKAILPQFPEVAESWLALTKAWMPKPERPPDGRRGE